MMIALTSLISWSFVLRLSDKQEIFSIEIALISSFNVWDPDGYFEQYGSTSCVKKN